MPIEKKGNNYIVDKENYIAHIELIRQKKENLWTTIDLEDLERVLNFPFSWVTRYDKTLHDYYAVSIVYSTDENGKRKHQCTRGYKRYKEMFQICRVEKSDFPLYFYILAGCAD